MKEKHRNKNEELETTSSQLGHQLTMLSAVRFARAAEWGSCTYYFPAHPLAASVTVTAVQSNKCSTHTIVLYLLHYLDTSQFMFATKTTSAIIGLQLHIADKSSSRYASESIYSLQKHRMHYRRFRCCCSLSFLCFSSSSCSSLAKSSWRCKSCRKGKKVTTIPSLTLPDKRLWMPCRDSLQR